MLLASLITAEVRDYAADDFSPPCKRVSVTTIGGGGPNQAFSGTKILCELEH